MHVLPACARLEDLAHAVLTIQSVGTVEEVEATLAAPVDAFVQASKSSGDESLAELATTYETNFDNYLEAEGLDAREAADGVDNALDRPGQRCIELGELTIEDLPQQP